MWHKPCRTFHPWCLCIKTRCLWSTYMQHSVSVHAVDGVKLVCHQDISILITVMVYLYITSSQRARCWRCRACLSSRHQHFNNGYGLPICNIQSVCTLLMHDLTPVCPQDISHFHDNYGLPIYNIQSECTLLMVWSSFVIKTSALW